MDTSSRPLINNSGPGQLIGGEDPGRGWMANYGKVSLGNVRDNTAVIEYGR